MTEKTCKELVSQELKNRMADLKTLWDSYCKGEENTENLGNIFEYGLSFDYVAPNTFKGQRKGYFRYQLSWGGPSDEFRIFAHPEYKENLYDNGLHLANWDIEKIEYWYLDWFDGACKKLTGKALEFLTELIQGFFIESGSFDAEYNKYLAEEE
jgi:hypothetical protein